VSDEVLLHALTDVLAPAVSLPTEPSMTELAALDRVVRAHHGPATTGRTRRSRRGAAGLVLAFVLAGAGSAAAATGAVPIPTPVRALAHDLGLPVDSPSVHAVHEAVGDLRHAERIGDRAAVAVRAATLRRMLGHLDPHEAEDLQTSARHELGAVDEPTPDAATAPPDAATAPPDSLLPPTDTATTSPPPTEPSTTAPPTETPPPSPAENDPTAATAPDSTRLE
jgi:hypothetical protein